MGRIRAPKSGQVHPNGQPAPAAPANTTGMVTPKTSPEASGAGNSAPPIEPMEEEKGFWSSAFSAVASLDVHDALDAVGMVPGLGIAADLSNAALYAYEKDYTNAAISLAAASPIGGQAATAAKHATKAAAKAKAKQEAAEAAAKKADAPPPSKPPKKDKDTEEPKEGEGKDGGYVEGGGKAKAKKWSKKEVEGRKVYQRDDLFDPDRVDDFGKTNTERMKKGRAPIGKDGEEINLHHLTQDEPGSMAELGKKFHSENDRVLHIYSNQYDKTWKGADGVRRRYNSAPPSMDRGPFNTWKKKYWKARAKDF